MPRAVTSNREMLMAALAPRTTETAELWVFGTGAPSAAAKVISAGEQADVVVPAALIAALEKNGKVRVGT